MWLTIRIDANNIAIWDLETYNKNSEWRQFKIIKQN